MRAVLRPCGKMIFQWLSLTPIWQDLIRDLGITTMFIQQMCLTIHKTPITAAEIQHAM